MRVRGLPEISAESCPPTVPREGEHGVGSEGVAVSPYFANCEYSRSVTSAANPTRHRPKLQALVYDILPSTTAVLSYAIGSRKLSANEQFFCWSSNSTKFVTNNSNYITRLFYNWPVQIKPKSSESRWNSFSFFFFSFFFTRGGCASCLRA